MAHARFEVGRWHIADIVGPEDSHIGPSPFEGLPADAAIDRCACCGQRITWRCVAHSDAGEVALLGRTCAKKAGLPGVPASLKAAKVDAARVILQDPEFRRWANSKRSPTRRDRSLLDNLGYQASRKPAEVFEALAAYRVEGPLLALDPDAPVALALGKRAARVDVRLGWSTWHRKAGKCWAARLTARGGKFGVVRSFARASERDNEGRACFLTDAPGLWEIHSGQTRATIRINADGTAAIVEDIEGAIAKLPPL